MRKFHLYHISFFDSLLGGLKAAGVPMDKLTQRSYIRRFNLENASTYLPYQVGYEFMINVKGSQSIDCISSEFYGGFELEQLSEYGEFLSHCPDLYTILENGIKYDHLIQSNGKLYLQTGGALSWICMVHTDPPSEGRHLSEQINIAMFAKVFHLIFGPEWTPLEIKITSPDGRWLKNLLPSSDFKLHTNCREIGFRFRTEDLAAKNSHYKESTEPTGREMASVENASIEVFKGLKDGYLPTLDEFSDFFGLSKRSAIREFNKAGTSFKEMMNRQRFLRALELMRDFNLPVEAISLALGYAHTSNFIKAFKRWTSTTPGQYRNQLSYL